MLIAIAVVVSTARAAPCDCVATATEFVITPGGTSEGQEVCVVNITTQQDCTYDLVELQQRVGRPNPDIEPDITVFPDGPSPPLDIDGGHCWPVTWTLGDPVNASMPTGFFSYKAKFEANPPANPVTCHISSNTQGHFAVIPTGEDTTELAWGTDLDYVSYEFEATALPDDSAFDDWSVLESVVLVQDDCWFETSDELPCDQAGGLLGAPVPLNSFSSYADEVGPAKSRIDYFRSFSVTPCSCIVEQTMSFEVSPFVDAEGYYPYAENIIAMDYDLPNVDDITLTRDDISKTTQYVSPP